MMMMMMMMMMNDDDEDSDDHIHIYYISLYYIFIHYISYIHIYMVIMIMMISHHPTLPFISLMSLQWIVIIRRRKMMMLMIVTDIFPIGSLGFSTFVGCYGLPLLELSSQLEMAACGACEVE